MWVRFGDGAKRKLAGHVVNRFDGMVFANV